MKASAFAALALAFASFGDAFLYPFLPVNFSAVGIPVGWVGFLLAINRFVRMISNTLIVHALARFGLRSSMILAVLLAVVSTLGYGIATGILAWIVFRVLWGLAFSAMRIGTLGYALQQERRGFALGLTRSLQEAGPMIALLLAPLLLHYFGSRTIFYILALLSVPAFYFSFALPRGDDRTQALKSVRVMRWPSTLNAITLLTAIIIDGIFVVVLGVLFLHHRENISVLNATALAAFYLAYRRVCLVVLSPAGGWIADKIGLDRVFNGSIAMVVVGLIIMLFGWIAVGAIIVFTFYSVNAAVTPGSASRGSEHALGAVAANATWRDIGAALGTLIGGFLISSQYLNTVLAVAVLALLILLFVHLGASRNATKLFYLWR